MSKVVAETERFQYLVQEIPPNFVEGGGVVYLDCNCSFVYSVSFINHVHELRKEQRVVSHLATVAHISYL